MKKKTCAPPELVPYLKEMIFELKIYTLRSCQIPDTRKSSLDGRNIWVVESRNPTWYSFLLRKYPKQRKKKWVWGVKAKRTLRESDSKITREDITRVLKKLVSNKVTTSKYAKDLIEIARRKSLLNKKEQTEIEIVFCIAFNIVLSDQEILLMKDVCSDYWIETAEYYKKHKSLPEWITKEPPF